MPPWFADPTYGHFRNDPTLTEREIATLAAWADNGAPEGDAGDKPKPVQWPEGWQVEPDVILSIPDAHAVPAKGEGEIKSFIVPNPFRQDTWVRSIEVRPGNASVVHHVMVQVPEEIQAPASSSWGSGLEPCTLNSPRVLSETQPIVVGDSFNRTPRATSAPRNFAILEAVYAPGSPPMDFSVYNSAKLIPGGGNLRIEVHYTPNGTATSDRTRIGFKLAGQAPQRRYITLAPRNLANIGRPIPAGASNWETRGELEFGQDAELVWLMPHMHLRGKDMRFILVPPGGRAEVVLDAKFDFNWQLGYELERPIRVAKGTRLYVVAHHDNSEGNRQNPDPSREVTWGDLTSQEMVLPWFGVIVEPDTDPERLLAVRQTACSAPNGTFPVIPGLNPPAPRTIPGLPNVPLPTIPVPIRRN
jgi:hypothetical protein